MRKLSEIPAPAVAGVVRERNVAAAIAQIKNCRHQGADMIDLHLSCLEDQSVEALRKIIESTPLPILALNYNNNWDRTSQNLSEEERVGSLLTAVEAGAAGVDIQGYTFHLPSKKNFCGEDRYSFTKGDPKEIVTERQIIAKQCELIEDIHRKGAQVLLSCHPGIPMNCQQVLDLARFLQERNPDIIKIVTKAETPEDLEEAIRTMQVLKREIKTPISFHASGKTGIPSRIINPILGGQIAFCVERFDEGSTPEQLDLRSVRAIVDNARRIL